MVAVITVPYDVPEAPPNWSAPSTSKSISTPARRSLIPVGAAYTAYARRKLQNLSFDDEEKEDLEEQQKLKNSKANGGAAEEDFGVGDEPESAELLARESKDWKSQDHYAVLGLSKFRYKVTPDQIKIAQRKKVLKHHPDKKAKSGDSDNDQFFKCIQKAHEILTNPEKKRQFDSVDPYYQALEDKFEPSEATKKIQKNPDSFFTILQPVFARESRFSKDKEESVPQLGGNDDPKAKVEGFYDYWYNFDSWRSFEYLDKEVNEGSDSRDEKRFTEKKNRTERARRKKEDNARVRSLVDLALGLDPRIKRIKQEEKEERERKKNKGKPTAAQKKAEEEAAKKAAEANAQAEAAKEADAKAEAKKAKAAAANAAKKARRAERAAAEGTA